MRIRGNRQRGIVVAIGVLVLTWIASGKMFADTQEPVGKLAPTAADLRISISAPTSMSFGASSSERVIVLHEGDPHLNVIVQNTSNHPIRVLQEGNSSGYQSLFLEITALDGKPLSVPIKVERLSRAWPKNITAWDVLASQEALVREVELRIPALQENTVSRFDDYWNFPIPEKGGFRRVTMRAVLEISEPPDQTVRVESPLCDYTIRRTS